MEKECFKCGETKDISFFYKHSKMTDGHLGKCKECTKSDVQLNYRDKIDQYKKYDQIRNQKRKEYISKKNKEYAERTNYNHGKNSKSWVEKNRVKRDCHIVVGNKIKNGTLSKGLCQICKTDKRIQAHHYSYDYPLNVVWLCEKHHSKVHWWLRWNKREQKTKRL